VGLWGADGRELRPVLQQPKRLALLAYLVLASRSGFVRRDLILGAFWAELDQDHARSALRQALYFLHSALGQQITERRGGDELGIRPGAIWCDAIAFQDAISAGQLQQALDLYQNDLLPGFFVTEAPEFERWMESERDRLRRLAVDAAWRLAERAAGEDSDAAVHWARRAAALTPDDETAVQRLLRFMQHRGDRAGALRAYAAFRQRLEQEYGLEPSAETQTLVRQIRQASGAPVEGAGIGIDPLGPDPGSMPAPIVLDQSSEQPMPHREVQVRAGSARVTADTVGVDSAARRGFPRVRTLLGAGLAVAAIAMAALSIMTWLRGPESSGHVPDLVVISPFEVLDPRFDVWGEGLMSVLAANLDGAGPLRTVSPTVAMRRWDGRYDRDSATRLGRATGAAAAVTGRVIGGGEDSVRIVALLVDPEKGEQLTTVEVRGRGDRIDRLTDSLTVALLREMGRTRPMGPVRLAAIGSRSLPALKAFLRGDQFYRKTEWDSALAFYHQAVELDTTFATALRRIGNVLMWQSLAGGELAREYHERAGRFNRGLAPRDSLLVLADSLASALYGFEADPDWWAHARRHAAVLADASRRYPDDPEIWNALGEGAFHFQTIVGISIPEILAAFDHAILIDSSFAPAYLHPIGLAMTLGDSTRALRYAREYLRWAHGDVTARAIAVFKRTVEQGSITLADSVQLAASDEPAELFEAWVPLYPWPDSGEAGLRIARWLAARPWADPPPFDDPAFNRNLFARSLAYRGHLAEALHISGPTDAEFFGELAWLGAVPAAQVEEWLANENVSVARSALPFLANRRDTAAIARFVRRRTESYRSLASAGDGVQARSRRDLAGFDVAAGQAWLALAAGDSAAALERLLAVPDSLCHRCYTHRIPRAELLLAANRTAEASSRLDFELTAIVGGPRPADFVWRLIRAEAADRSGDTATANGIRRRARGLWRNADAAMQQLLDSRLRGAGR
jgi:serine/threonine-protein kinase